MSGGGNGVITPMVADLMNKVSTGMAGQMAAQMPNQMASTNNPNYASQVAMNQFNNARPQNDFAPMQAFQQFKSTGNAQGLLGGKG